MRRAMLRELRAHPGRIAMTALAIVIGVAFVVATWIVSDSFAAGELRTANRTDVAARVTPDRPGTLLSEEQRSALAALPGVGAATGIRTGYGALIGADGKVSNPFDTDIAGTGWDASQRFRLLEGQAPTRADEVAVEGRAARSAGLRVGDQTRIGQIDGQYRAVRVVGLFAYQKAGVELAPIVAYEPATAATLLGPGYTGIELSGADQASIAAAARAVLDGSSTVDTGDELASAAREAAERDARSIRNPLLTFAAVALFVGVFVIANTFTMLVAQRTRQFALLRAVGARRGQVRRALVAEAAVLGGAAGALGCVAGIGLAAGIIALVRTTAPDAALVVSPTALLVGLAVGVVITVVAAYGSARRAAVVAPVAALRTDAVPARRSLVLRTTLGVIAVAAGVVTLIATNGEPLTDALRVLKLGAAMTGWLGVLLLAPVLVTLFVRPLGVALGRRRADLSGRRVGPVWTMAVRNAIRDPRRTAATASALMVGLALVCAFATLGASLNSTFTKGVNETLPASTVMVRSAVAGGDVDPALIAAIAGSSTVEYVDAPRLTYGQLGTDHDSRTAEITTLDPASLGRVVTAPMVSGRPDLRAGVLVPTELADRLGIRPGMTVTIALSESVTVSRPVAGVYRASQVVRGVLMDRASLPDDVGFVSYVLATGSDPTAVRAGLDRLAADRPDIVVLDHQGVIDDILDPVRTALFLIYGLLAAAVLIAVFGVVNTLALAVIERTREIGVLRAVGALRSVVRRTVRVESVLIATYGGVLGVGVGLLVGAVMQHILTGTSIVDFTVPVATVVVALVGMVIVGVLAAVWPARRAARSDVLAAISVE